MAKNEKSLSKSGFYYLIYNVLNMAFPFITGIYVTRKLLPENIGAVAAAQNLAQYFVILAFLGIPTYGLREISKVRDDNEERSTVFSELFFINLFSTCIFFAIYLILIISVPIYRADLKLYVLVGGAIALNAFNISWLYEGLEEFKFISLRNLAFKCISFFLLVVLVKTRGDYLKYAGITVLGTAGNYIVNMLYSPRYVRLKTKGLCLKRHMKSILFLVAVNLAIEIYSLLDITMMNFWCSKDSIAYYKYGHNIQRILLQVVNTFTIVLIPRISYYYKKQKYEDFNNLVSKALKLIIIVSVPMIIGILFTSAFLITKLYGDQYIHSAWILDLFSALLLISPIGYLLGSRILLVTDHENKMIISVGTGAVVNCIGNTILIPYYAEFGAAVASIISEVVVMIVYVSMGKRYIHLYGIKRTSMKVAIAACVESIYLYICSLTLDNGWVRLILQVFGSVIIYFTILYVGKEDTVVIYVKMFKHRLFKR